MIRVELDTVPKWRNQNEWRPVNRARAEGYEETGDHSVIITLCKRLVADGYGRSLVRSLDGVLPRIIRHLGFWRGLGRETARVA
jgi:hypothetical protein